MRFTALAALLLFSAASLADEYADTIDTFQRADASNLFDSAYGYAVFPTIGKGGIGKGRERGGSKGPGAPETPISQSTRV